MILSDLFENVESSSQEAKRLLADWRASAKAPPYELTIDTSGSNASNGFPVVRKAGTWFGGVFIPLGGASKEPDRMLGVNHRAKAWIKSKLAPSLEKLMAEGREVRISDSASGGSDSTYYQKAQVLRPDHAAEQLVESIRETDRNGETRLAVYWWLATSAEKADNTTLNISVGFGFNMNKPVTYANMLISGNKQELKTLASKIVDLKSAAGEKHMQLARELVMTFFPEAHVKSDTWVRLMVELGSVAKVYTPVDREKFMSIVGKYV